MDTYRSFAALQACEIEGRDYRIRIRRGRSRIVVMAPHGGGIERGTSEIAEAIAGPDHGFYAFEGLRPAGNGRLHITSDHFDEPCALALLRDADIAISIHGAKGAEPAAYLGGLDRSLRDTILALLRGAGIEAADDPSPTRQGRSVRNLCNRGRSGHGVQIELTYGLRRALFAGLDPAARRRPRPLFDRLVAALREALGPMVYCHYERDRVPPHRGR